jgi:hypothetical protein
VMIRQNRKNRENDTVRYRDERRHNPPGMLPNEGPPPPPSSRQNDTARITR